MRDIQPLVNAGVAVAVAHAPFINNGLINDNAGLAQAIIVIESIRNTTATSRDCAYVQGRKPQIRISEIPLMA